MSRLLCPTRFWHFQAIKIFIQNVRFWRDISLADVSGFNLQAIAKGAHLNKMNSQVNFWHGCYLSRWKLCRLQFASRDVPDKEQCSINPNLWRDSGDVENTQVGKSHWNIKKMSIMGIISYLFFRTQDGERIYFLISSATKKVLCLFLQKGQIQCFLKKSPTTGTSTMSFSKVVCNQKMWCSFSISCVAQDLHVSGVGYAATWKSQWDQSTRTRQVLHSSILHSGPQRTKDNKCYTSIWQ